MTFVNPVQVSGVGNNVTPAVVAPKANNNNNSFAGQILNTSSQPAADVVSFSPAAQQQQVAATAQQAKSYPGVAALVKAASSFVSGQAATAATPKENAPTRATLAQSFFGREDSGSGLSASQKIMGGSAAGGGNL